MNTGIRGDFAQPPRLFAVDPKSEAESPDPQQEQVDPGLSSPEVSEAETPLAPEPKRRESRKTVASCDSTHTVYLLRDAHGMLLYVGVTLRAHERWKKHRKSKPWWPDVKHLELEHFPSRAEAERREQELIRSLYPKHNIAHRDRFDPDPQPGPECEDCEVEMWWWDADDKAASAREHNGFVFAGWWFCDNCLDEDWRPAPPEWAALGLASEPALRDLLAARKLRETADQLAHPYLMQRVREALNRAAQT